MHTLTYLVVVIIMLVALIVAVIAIFRRTRRSSQSYSKKPVSIQLITVPELAQMLLTTVSLLPNEPADFVLVDARSQFCYEEFRIHRAINIPPAVPGCPDTETEAKRRINNLPLNKIIIFYDQAADHDGEAMRLTRQVACINRGYEANIRVLETGLTGWTGAGYDLESPRPI
jgi:rhodanese-related sulfurtransferase